MSDARRERAQRLILDQQLQNVQNEQRAKAAAIEAELANKLDASELPAKSASDADKFLSVADDGSYTLVSAAAGPQGPQGPAGASGDSAEAMFAEMKYELASPFYSTTNASNSPYADPLIMFHDLFTDRLLGRGSEIPATRTTSSGGTSSLSLNETKVMFDGSYDSNYGIFRTTHSDYSDGSVTLNLDLRTVSPNSSANGFTYPQGYFYVTCYAGRGIQTIAARFKKNDGTWYTPASNHYETVAEYAGRISGYRIWQQYVGNYLVEAEFTMTPYASTDIWINTITFHGTRSGIEQGGSINCGGGTFFGEVRGVENGTEYWSINQDGVANFQDAIKYQGRPVLPVNQFFDATNGYVYTVYGVTHNWRVTRAGSAGMSQSTGTSGNPPNSLSAVQGLSYS